MQIPFLALLALISWMVKVVMTSFKPVTQMIISLG